MGPMLRQTHIWHSEQFTVHHINYYIRWHNGIMISSTEHIDDMKWHWQYCCIQSSRRCITFRCPSTSTTIWYWQMLVDKHQTSTLHDVTVKCLWFCLQLHWCLAKIQVVGDECCLMDLTAQQPLITHTTCYKSKGSCTNNTYNDT